jgi:MFS family permease
MRTNPFEVALMLRSRAFLSLNLAHFFDHFVLLILPTAALAISPDYAGALMPGTCAFAAFALATLPAGWLGDRWGRVPMMRLFWFGTGAACVLAGLAPGSIGFALGLGLIGAFAAIYHPVATAMVMGLREQAGHARAVNGIWGNMGVAAAALATAMLSDWVDWRAAFLVPGLAMLGIGCAYAAIPAAAQTAMVAARHFAASMAGTQIRVLAFIAVSGLFGGLIFNGATIALPKLLAERLPAASLAVVGILTALVFAAAAFAQLPVGRLLDRWGARPLLFTIEGTKTPLLLAMALTPGWGGAAFALPVMLLVFGEIPITAWLLGRHLDERWWSRAYALQYLLSLGIAAATVPLIAALHSATGDQTALFLVLTACSATILLSTILVPRRSSSPPCAAARPASALAG